MLHLKTAKLAKWQIRLLCWSGGGLWATGVAWLLLHNFGQVQGDFGPEANPVEPWMLRIHGAAMIAALLGCGSLLVVHVWRGWSYKSQRLVGLMLTATLSILITTGYLLYYLGNEEVRSIASLVHWAVGLGVLPVFVWHYIAGKRIRRS